MGISISKLCMYVCVSLMNIQKSTSEVMPLCCGTTITKYVYTYNMYVKRRHRDRNRSVIWSSQHSIGLFHFVLWSEQTEIFQLNWKMSETLQLRGTLLGHNGWVTQIATNPKYPDMILSSSRGKCAIIFNWINSLWKICYCCISYNLPRWLIVSAGDSIDRIMLHISYSMYLIVIVKYIDHPLEY